MPAGTSSARCSYHVCPVARLVGPTARARYPLSLPLSQDASAQASLQSNTAVAFLGLLQNSFVPKFLSSPHSLLLLPSFYTYSMGRAHLAVPSQAGCGVQTRATLHHVTRSQLLLPRPHANSYLAILFPPRKALVVFKPPGTVQCWWGSFGPLTKLEMRQGSQHPRKSHSVPGEGPKQSDLCKDLRSTLCSLILLKEIVLVTQLRASLEAFSYRPIGVGDPGRPLLWVEGCLALDPYTTLSPYTYAS